MQAVEGRQWWMLTFGSSEIRSCAAGLTSERAIHSATPAGLNIRKTSIIFYRVHQAGFIGDTRNE